MLLELFGRTEFEADEEEIKARAGAMYLAEMLTDIRNGLLKPE